MKNFDEYQITFKVILANPVGCNMPIKTIHEALEASMQKLILNNKVAMGQTSVEMEIIK